MDAWIAGVKQVLNGVLHQPGSNLELWVLSAAGVLIALISYHKMSSATQFPNVGSASSVFMLAVGLIVLFAALTACDLYLVPKIGASHRVWVLIGGGILASAVIVVPIICGFQRAGYVAGLMTWATGMIAAVLLTYLLSGAFDAFGSGSKSVVKGVDRKNETQQFLDQ